MATDRQSLEVERSVGRGYHGHPRLLVDDLDVVLGSIGPNDAAAHGPGGPGDRARACRSDGRERREQQGRAAGGTDRVARTTAAVRTQGGAPGDGNFHAHGTE